MAIELITSNEAVNAMTLSIAPARSTASPAPQVRSGVASHWREELPTIVGTGLTLRELRVSDAGSLLALLSVDEVARFLSPPPTTLEAFEQFIRWTQRKRAEGAYACFAVVPKGMDMAVGFFQVRALDADFRTAEWGFALGKAFWGTGLFAEGATHTLDFAFGTVGVSRLEARACLKNGRGNGALRKVGALHEAVLRRSFQKDGQSHDQALWSILDIDWATSRGRALGVTLQGSERRH
jgi:[ribosomal protein S5]-alanine N-acetyltransferase